MPSWYYNYAYRQFHLKSDQAEFWVEHYQTVLNMRILLHFLATRYPINPKWSAHCIAGIGVNEVSTAN